MTAVEWLEDCLTEKHSNGSFVWNTRADLEALFKQAKEIEKQQQGYSLEDLKEAFSMGRVGKTIRDFNEQFKNK